MAEADYTLAQASAAASAHVIDRVTILGVIPQACSALQCTSQRSTICHSRCKLQSIGGLAACLPAAVLHCRVCPRSHQMWGLAACMLAALLHCKAHPKGSQAGAECLHAGACDLLQSTSLLVILLSDCDEHAVERHAGRCRFWL